MIEQLTGGNCDESNTNNVSCASSSHRGTDRMVPGIDSSICGIDNGESGQVDQRSSILNTASFCHECGTKILAESKYCSECGTKLRKLVENARDKDELSLTEGSGGLLTQVLENKFGSEESEGDSKKELREEILKSGIRLDLIGALLK